MTDADEDIIVVCERLPMSKWLSLGQRIGLGICILLSFGVALLGLPILIVRHYLSPERLWVSKGRLFASKILPEAGVEVDRIELTNVVTEFYGAPVARGVKVGFAVDCTPKSLFLPDFFYSDADLNFLLTISRFSGEAIHHRQLKRKERHAELQKEGYQCCTNCGELFMPADHKDWTTQGYCSKFCMASKT